MQYMTVLLEYIATIEAKSSGPSLQPPVFLCGLSGYPVRMHYIQKKTAPNCNSVVESTLKEKGREELGRARALAPIHPELVQ